MPQPARGQVASLVKDIDPRRGAAQSSNPGHFLPLGNRVVFAANSHPAGAQLWASDGTSLGTELLADSLVHPHFPGGPYLYRDGNVLFWMDHERLWRTDGTRRGTVPLTPPDTVRLWHGAPFLRVGELYFLAAEGVGEGNELWRTDGTAEGTWRVADILSGHASSQPRDFVELGGALYFLARGSCQGYERVGLWRSDGTAGGTVSVFCREEVDLAELTRVGELLFFSTSHHPSGLWVSDGTTAGTRRLELPLEMPQSLTPGEGALFFTAGRFGPSELWRSDGSEAGTMQVADLGDHQRIVGRPSFLATGILVLAEGLDGERQLFRTTGSPESTVALRDLCPGTCRDLRVVRSWLPEDPPFVEANHRVFFVGDDGVHGTELWVTDGTGAGTEMLADHCPGPCGAISGLAAQGDEVFFVAQGPGEAHELWRTDGTVGSTVRVIAPGSGGKAVPVGAPAAVRVGGRLFFAARDETHGVEPWVHFDASGATRLVRDLARGGVGSEPSAFADLGGRLAFLACDQGRRALWTSGGTPESTVPAWLDTPGRPCIDPVSLTVSGDLGYFVRINDLWRTDGTATGTFPVTSFSGRWASSSMVDLEGRLHFVVGGQGGGEVWTSDGTSMGTSLAFGFPEEVWQINHLTALGGEVFFVASGSESGEQVWRSDGSPQGTRRLTSLELVNAFSGAGPRFARAGGRVYFFVHDFMEQTHQLWKTDGTVAGTTLVSSIHPGEYLASFDQPVELGGAVYFLASIPEGSSGFHRVSLWRSDGTTAGTLPVVVLSRYRFGLDFPGSPPLRHGGTLYFAAPDEGAGWELWASDGTAGGTRMVRDLAPGATSSFPGDFTAAGDVVYFAASTPSHGRELWRTDGTADGTRMVHDIAPGPHSSFLQHLTVAGDYLFFSADDGVSGAELWSLPLAKGAVVCRTQGPTLCIQGGRYRVEMAWEDFQGEPWIANAAPLTADTGYFYFFDPDNVETVIKVLDARHLNDHLWVFYGALSNVEYTLTVTDTETGLTRRYFNPATQFASIGDTHAFGPAGAWTTRDTPFSADGRPGAGGVLAGRSQTAASGGCEPGPTRLCLNGQRFAVEMAWEDFQGGAWIANAAPVTTDTGYFYFFDPKNVETVIKVLDGRHLNGRFWVFYGALSNVGYTLTVTDTHTGQVRTYRNPIGSFGSVGDTAAF